MYSNYNQKHRYNTSPYKAPSRNANVYESSHNRSQVNLDDICDETWPLDEVIEKVDIKSDSEDDYNYNKNIQTWHSGPQVISENFNSGKDYHRTPGEGIIFSAFNEGSRTWKDKTVRHHEYNSKKGTQFDLSNKYTKPGKTYDSNNNYMNEELNDSFVNFNEVDVETPTLRDVGIQCNLKKYKNPTPKTTEPIVTRKPPIKVIKSSNNGFVSTYSDVPKLGSSPKAMETRHKIVDVDHSDWVEPNQSDAIYSKVDKSSKNRNNNINIIYKQPLNDSLNSYRSANDRIKSYDVKSKEYSFNVNTANAPKTTLPNPIYGEPVRNRSHNGSYRDFYADFPDEKEIIEETISISNASTEESYRPNQLIALRYQDNLSFTGNSITSRGSSNYRQQSPARSVDRSSLPRHNPYATLEKNRELKGKLKKKKNVPESEENVLLDNNSLRLKSSKSSPYSERLYKSNADLRDQFLRDETRGGLAAAYKNRQQNQSQINRNRAVSLNRMNAIANEEDYSNNSHVPSRYLSQSQLNNSGSRNSDTSYSRSNRLMQHERDPIVMYIPTAQRTNTDSPRLTSILRNNSSKSNVTLPNKPKKMKEAKSQSKTNLKESTKDKSKESKDKKKLDLNRRHSMPKDTKFNWFSKFKIKSK